MSALAALSALLAMPSGEAASPGYADGSAQPVLHVEAIDAEFFATRSLTLGNGTRGQIVSFRSGNPYHLREWFNGDHGAEAALTGQLSWAASVHDVFSAIDERLRADFFLRQVLDGGFVEHGVTIGSRGGEADVDMTEMLAFFHRELGSTSQAGRS